MSIYVNSLAIGLGLLIILVVLKNLVRKKINERQSLLWLLIGVGGVILGIWPGLILKIANRLGIWYPPAILFLLLFVGLILVTFYQSITISILNHEVHELTMQVSLLKHKVNADEAAQSPSTAFAEEIGK